MIVLDTNVLVRLITKDDIEQTRHAVALLSGFGPFCVSRVVLLELGWVLRARYRYPREEIGRALHLVVTLGNVDVEDRDRCETALGLYAAGLDLGDAFVLAFSPDGATVATFDEPFVVNARSVGGGVAVQRVEDIVGGSAQAGSAAPVPPRGPDRR